MRRRVGRALPGAGLEGQDRATEGSAFSNEDPVMRRLALIALTGTFPMACEAPSGEPTAAPTALGPPVASPLGTLSPAPDEVVAQFVTPDWSAHPEPVGAESDCATELTNLEPGVSFAFEFTGPATAAAERACAVRFFPPSRAVVSAGPVAADLSGADEVAFVIYVPPGVRARPVVETAAADLVGSEFPASSEPSETVFPLPPDNDLSQLRSIRIDVPGDQPSNEIVVRQIALLKRSGAQ